MDERHSWAEIHNLLNSSLLCLLDTDFFIYFYSCHTTVYSNFKKPKHLYKMSMAGTKICKILKPQKCKHYKNNRTEYPFTHHRLSRKTSKDINLYSGTKV